MMCRGSDGSGYPVDGARCCAVCGVAFPDVQRVPQHVSEEDEHEIDWDEILREWAR
jgi:hypothetical protein